jgi:hypothetical protein
MLSYFGYEFPTGLTIPAVRPAEQSISGVKKYNRQKQQVFFEWRARQALMVARFTR